MSSFLYSSAAAKVAPEILSPPLSHVPVTHTHKKAMDSSTSPDLLTEHKPSDDMIKPMHGTFDQKIDEEDYDKVQCAAGVRAYQAPAPSEGGLWPKYTELPSSPFSEKTDRERPDALFSSEHASEPGTYRCKDRPPSPSSFESEPPYQDTKPDVNPPSSPPYWIHSGPMRGSHASSNPKTEIARDAALSEASRPVDDVLLGGMQQSYKRSAGGKLSSVVEESESFSRREFGADVLLYMSTHSSANHAANFAMHSSYNPSNSSSKFHSSRANVTLRTHHSYPPNNFMNSKSAPAGTASRARSTFAMFRRGSSEGGKAGGRVAFERQRPRRVRSLGHTLLWPLVKIRNGYVGCMMGLEGSGDLSGMAQGGSYATRAQYFADIPLSKSDSRNYG